MPTREKSRNGVYEDSELVEPDGDQHLVRIAGGNHGTVAVQRTSHSACRYEMRSLFRKLASDRSLQSF
jgi:hypothetical protein